MKIGPYVVATVLSAGLAVHAQEPIVRPAVGFNGASIKPIKGYCCWSVDVPEHGNIAFRGTALFLISYAYDVKHPKVIKQDPAWLSSEYFQVRAIPDDGVARDQTPLMMQSLLIDRFKLRAHWEIWDEPVYSLELARQDGTLKPGLKRSKADCYALWEGGKKGNEPDAPRDDKGQPICSSSIVNGAGRLHLGGLPWADLFEQLARDAEFFGALDRPVVDGTDLSGNFEMHLEFRNEALGLPATLTQFALPSVKDAVQEQLGLKLVPKMEPWRVLVIDSVEQPLPD